MWFSRLLSVSLLWHSKVQIIKSLASVCQSVCKHYYGRNFDSILMKFCKVIQNLKNKIEFVWDKNLITPSPILPRFLKNLHYGLCRIQSGITLSPAMKQISRSTERVSSNLSLRHFVHVKTHTCGDILQQHDQWTEWCEIPPSAVSVNYVIRYTPAWSTSPSLEVCSRFHCCCTGWWLRGQVTAPNLRLLVQY